MCRCWTGNLGAALNVVAFVCLSLVLDLYGMLPLFFLETELNNSDRGVLHLCVLLLIGAVDMTVDHFHTF